CMVKFRPHDKWQGEFGFDWLREGDSGQLGDTWFGKIMGRYYNEVSFSTLFTNTNSWSNYFKKELDMYNRKLRLYTNLQINWKSVKGKPYFYAVPMLTLLKGKTATFNLKLEIEETPKKLTFEFADDDATTYLKLNKTEITDIREGKYTLYNQLSIECIKEFDDIQILYVKADDEICGAIKIHPNSSKYIENENKIVFIKVKTDLNGEINGLLKEEEKEKIIKILGQALVKPKIEEEKEMLDCKGNVFKTKFATFVWIDTKKRIAAYKISIEGKTETQAIQLQNDLLRYLEQKTRSKFGDKYDNYYKIYLINEPASWNGYSNSETKMSICFQSRTEETVIHELLHMMRLPHTFASVGQRAIFTYEQGKTNNIMDYSHQKKYGNVPRITLFHWQWKIINPKLLNLCNREISFWEKVKKYFKY
ncbi:hypothetical protein, partial [Capnocytophaga catalasegens]